MKTLFYLCLLIVAVCELEALTCNQIRAFVDGHNARRFKLAKGEVRGQPPASNLKYITWDYELQAKATQWAAKNRFAHNPDKTIPSRRYETGENIFSSWNSDQTYELNPDEVVESWFNEYENFTYGPIKASDFDGSKDYQIGHYTQVAWADTKHVGCAIKETVEGGLKKYLAVCNYGPAGNFRGQTPYKVGNNNPVLICDCQKNDVNCNCNFPYGKSCAKF